MSKPVESKEEWSVIVLYDDPSTRRRAMTICDLLTRRYLGEIEFKLEAWSSDSLVDPDTAQLAASRAASADFVVVCLSPDHGLAPAIRPWFDSWTHHRDGREGVMLDITESGGITSPHAEQTSAYLRETARRAEMDYLTRLPSTTAGRLPDTIESAVLRADQMTAVLDDILHQSTPPSHFGLNE